MRIAPFVLAAAVLVVVPSAHAADDDVVVRKWLVLAPVDVSGRRPLRADAVFAKHLLDRASPPPKAGDDVVGTLGKHATWTAREAAVAEKKDDDGVVAGDDVAWAYA